MIDFGKQKEVPTRDLIHELLDFVDDVVDALGSRKEIEHIHTILQRGTSADEQLEVYNSSNNDLNAVVDRSDRTNHGKRSGHRPGRSHRSQDFNLNDLEVAACRSAQERPSVAPHPSASLEQQPQ